MDPNLIQNTVEPMTPDSLKVPTPSVEKPKSNKANICFLGFLLILALAAAGVFAYLYFTNQKPESNPVAGDGEVVEPTEETEITDTQIKEDLDKKIAILFNIDDTGSTFATGGGIGSYDIKLFQDGDISQRNKTDSIIRHTLEFRALSEQETVAALNQSGYTGETELIFRESMANGVDGDTVAQKYKEIFGTDLIKEDTGTHCGGYRYNYEYDFYYDDVLGCGGRTPYERFYYKNRYTSDGKHAYVYTSAAVASLTITKLSEYSTSEDLPYNVYCDIAYLGNNEITEDAEVCATLQTYEEKDSFTINASNYEQYAKYRFVFDKSDDGNYYFNKVEKL